MEKTLRITLVLKMITGFVAAYLLALLFKIDYSYTAGVIAVLSLALTKEAVIKQAIIRFSASLIGIGIGALTFFLLGYQIYALVIVVILLIVALYLLHFEVGIVLALVLISQEYLGGSPAYALNALYVLLVGMGIAILLNFYSPTPKKLIHTNMLKIDKQISDIFLQLSLEQNVDFANLKLAITKAKNDLILAKENRSIKDVEKRISYLGMREYQTLVLERINTILFSLPPSIHKEKLVTYLGTFVHHIGTIDYATDLLNRLDLLHQDYEKLPLPQTRKEFEERAELFHVLSEIRSFLEAKINYHQHYDI